MQLPIQITFRGVTRSDAIEQYAKTRAEKLEALFDRITSCRVALEAPHRHATHGTSYRVRIDVTVPGAEIVVTRTPNDDASYKDLYAAIDATFDDAARQLNEYVKRLRGEVKSHERARHGHVTKLFAHEGYGFLRSSEANDGDELYFHKNAVLHDGFERLRIGSRVRFVEDEAESGPHASTVAVLS